LFNKALINKLLEKDKGLKIIRTEKTMRALIKIKSNYKNKNSYPFYICLDINAKKAGEIIPKSTNISRGWVGVVIIIFIITPWFNEA